MSHVPSTTYDILSQEGLTHVKRVLYNMGDLMQVIAVRDNHDNHLRVLRHPTVHQMNKSMVDPDTKRLIDYDALIYRKLAQLPTAHPLHEVLAQTFSTNRVGYYKSLLPYAIIEHLQGTRLDDALQETTSPLSYLGLIQKHAQAVEVCHSYGLAHRDIKPPNAIVTPQGNVKLIDFSTALLKRTPDLLTQREIYIGTLGYAFRNNRKQGTSEQLHQVMKTSLIDLLCLACEAQIHLDPINSRKVPDFDIDQSFKQAVDHLAGKYNNLPLLLEQQPTIKDFQQDLQAIIDQEQAKQTTQIQVPRTYPTKKSKVPLYIALTTTLLLGTLVTQCSQKQSTQVLNSQKAP